MARQIGKVVVVEHLVKKLGGRTFPCSFLWVGLIESNKEFVQQLRESMIWVGSPGILKDIGMVIALNLKPIRTFKFLRNFEVSQPSGKGW